MEVVAIYDPYARVCVPNKVKNVNLVVGVNETRYWFQQESCECTCNLDENVCHSKQ